MAAKITKVQVVRKPGKWGGYKMREITERGAVINSFEFSRRDDAVRCARSSAQANQAELVLL